MSTKKDTEEITKTLEDILSENGIQVNTENQYKLILWNDDHNSFDWVISCLMSFLNFSFEKAEKSAWTIHLKGKDTIKYGSKESLIPFKKILEDSGLTVTIEQ